MESKSDDSLKPQDLESSLDISDLLYLEQKTSNVVRERTQKIQYANTSVNWNNTILVINWQTGSDYISTKDSSLRVKVKTTDAARANEADGTITWGNFGSVLNCFKTVRVIGRGGDVVAQIDSSNLLNYYKVQYEHSNAWKSQQGKALIGLGTDAVAQNTEYLIPLQLICPFFENDELLPNMLCRGMRLEITLEQPSVAFVQTGTITHALGAYSLSNCELILDSYSLTSGAANWLNERSASNGLVLTYKDYENSNFVKPLASTSYSYESRKTASMANSVMTIFREQRATELAEDSFGATGVVAGDTFQYRVGSLYLPIQPISSVLQTYQQQNYCLDRLRSGQELGVTLEEFTQADGLSVQSAVLDRYWLEGSGLAINNSTTLTISGNNATSTRDKDIDIFLKHTRSLVIFLQQLRRSD